MTGYTGQAGKLTDRQREVLNLLRQEPKLSRRQIAARLGISPETVKAHAAQIKVRLAARDTARESTAARRAGRAENAR